MLTPTVRRTWAPQGQTPLLSCWDRRDRLSAISCITLSPQRARLKFYFTLLPDNTNAKAKDNLRALSRESIYMGSAGSRAFLHRVRSSSSPNARLRHRVWDLAASPDPEQCWALASPKSAAYLTGGA
jgi:hypothetical protein